VDTLRAEEARAQGGDRIGDPAKKTVHDKVDQVMIAKTYYIYDRPSLLTT
jgi:hypothetical protein